jgi:hypothetical protein
MEMSNLDRRVEKLEAIAADLAELEISDEDLAALRIKVRAEHRSRGEIPPVFMRGKGCVYVIHTGVSRCPGDLRKTDLPPDAARLGFTADNADSRK